MSNQPPALENEAYLSGIINADDDLLERIYDEFQEGVFRYIESNGGSREEAKDIFANALEVIYKRAKQGSLELKASFGAYLFGICKFQWLNILRSKKQASGVTDTVGWVHGYEEEPPDRLLERTLLHCYFRELFAQLSDDCRQIIGMRWEGRSYEEISAALGHRSQGYTRKRKHICQDRLIELVKNDPRIREWYQV